MHINHYKVIFWDFDGVIKESIEVKAEAFVKLFAEYGVKVQQDVKAHHLAHGGMSRFEKIPIYAGFAGQTFSEEQVQEYCQRFSQIAVQGVLDSSWVPGVEQYLRSNLNHQVFVLVSATPHDEMSSILKKLNLLSCFAAVYGAPTQKRDAIATTLRELSLPPSGCLMIGDAQADLDAARVNGIDFLLRKHPANESVFRDYTGCTVTSFNSL